ncbi:MAG: hypothetical protein LQ350_001392 [Teloschistes chrysophthalmus]|nr:MAG: hypothetical protein LQ350_001392 [Niorma chrysophthalma]
MAPKSTTKKNKDVDFDEESFGSRRQEEAFPRVSMTETPELDYLSSTSESDFPQVSVSKRGGTMSKATRAQAKKARKEQNRKTDVEETPFLRPAQDVLNRILHDESYKKSDYIIVYNDRHLGDLEKPLEEWLVEGVEEEEFIPQHRTLSFKRVSDGVKVWDRVEKIDLIFWTGYGAGLAQKAEDK